MTSAYKIYFTQGDALLGTESKTPSPAVLEALANICALRAGDELEEQHSLAAEVLLKFLIRTARSSVSEYRPYGAEVWESLYRDMVLVMVVPSAWGRAERALVRGTAVRVLGTWADPSSIIMMKEAEVCMALHFRCSYPFKCIHSRPLQPFTSAFILESLSRFPADHPARQIDPAWGLAILL